MERKYADMILKPYEEDGIVYTEFYKRYGMDKAGLIVGNPNEFVCAFNDRSISQLVLVDVDDLAGLKDFEFLRKLCVVYTRKPKKAVHIDALYENALESLIICGKDWYFDDKLDMQRLDGLKSLKVDRAKLFCNKQNCGLVSLELDSIGQIGNLESLAYFPNLEYLTLAGGQLGGVDAIQNLKKLRSLTLADVELKDAKGLRELNSLVNLSIDGKFNGNIIDELHYLSKLQYLKLDGYVKINDVSWAKKLKQLKAVILGCIVADGDLTPLCQIPYVLLKSEQKNYNLKDKDFSKLNAKDNADGIPVYKKF